MRHSQSVTVIDSSGPSLWSRAGEYRFYGTLFLILVLRDIKLRFRHTYLGVGWAVLQPLLPMLIFAAIFSRLHLETGGIPYPLFVFSGLTPWMFIGNAVSNASPTFVNNYSMLSKIYFPRAIMPAAIAAALALDGLVAFVALICVSFWYGYSPNAAWLLFPFVGLAALMIAMTGALAAASLTAVLRDLKNAVPFLVQVWLYASPVLYPVKQIPQAIRPFAGLNPIAGLLEAFRACLFGFAPDWGLILESGAAFLIFLGCTLALFHWLEADLAEHV